VHALTRGHELLRLEPGRAERHSQLDQPAGPRVQVRRKAYARYLGGGSSQGSGSESTKLELLNLAKCMHAHGLPSFPDPTTSLPPVPPSGSHTGNAIGIGGAYLVIRRQRSSGPPRHAGSSSPGDLRDRLQRPVGWLDAGFLCGASRELAFESWWR
jgi:hypothetical protein